MPRLPILSRDAFFARLPNNGGLRDLDYCLVNTSLGAMIEPTPIHRVPPGAVGVDVYDAAVTRRTELDETQFYSLMGTAGGGVFQNFAR